MINQRSILSVTRSDMILINVRDALFQQFLLIHTWPLFIRSYQIQMWHLLAYCNWTSFYCGNNRSGIAMALTSQSLPWLNATDNGKKVLWHWKNLDQSDYPGPKSTCYGQYRHWLAPCITVLLLMDTAQWKPTASPASYQSRPLWGSIFSKDFSLSHLITIVSKQCNSNSYDRRKTEQFLFLHWPQ